MENNRITFILPSRNNLELLKLAYQSIKDLKNEHDIIILDDASVDGTKEWLKNIKDDDLTIFTNPTNDRMGIVGMYNKGAKMAKTDIIFTFHADMVAGKNLDVNILKHLKRGTVVPATRIEPPLHPPGPEKIIHAFGNEPEEFSMDEWRSKNESLEVKDKTTKGLFAPWAIYKDDYLSIGGEDELFHPQSKDDSDLFNRFVLKGYDVVQPWDALVYHFTSRGSRFNKYAGGETGKNSPEWELSNRNGTRNFIRKWGHFVKHDSFCYPIIPPLYDIGFIVKNCTLQLMEALEPWCGTMYTDMNYMEYINSEQIHTKYDLKEKIKPFDNEKQNQILIEIDGMNINQQDFDVISKLSEILTDSGEEGEFELGNLHVHILALDTFEKELVVCKNEKY
jgi:glycosyltransferase involved in cell wall biosynthesis